MTYLPSLLYVLFIFTIISCQRHDGTETKILQKNTEHVINLNSVRDTLSLELDNWTRNISLRSLDKQEAALVDFGKVVYAMVDSEYIFTVEQGKPIKVFSASGAFDQVIGSSGKGPGEYLYPRKLVYNSRAKMLAVQTFNSFDPVPVYSLSSGHDVYTHPSSAKRAVRDINLSDDGQLELLESTIGGDTSEYWIESIDLDSKKVHALKIGSSIMNMGHPFLLKNDRNTIVHIPQSDTIFTVNSEMEITPFWLYDKGLQKYSAEKYISVKGDPDKETAYISGLRDYSIQSITPSLITMEMLRYGGGSVSAEGELFMYVEFSKVFHDRENNRSFHIRDYTVELPGGLKLAFDDNRFWSANGYFVKVFDAITLYDQIEEIAFSNRPDKTEAGELLKTIDIEDNVYILSGQWN